MYTITYLAEDGCGALRVLAISTPNEWTAVDVATSLRATSLNVRLWHATSQHGPRLVTF